MKQSVFKILLILFMFGFAGCNGQDGLDFTDLDTSPGYFVECYLVRGEVLKLSATKITPLKDDYVLDYSLKFEVHVDSVRLWQSLYSEAGSNYIYNYGSPRIFKPSEADDEIGLTVITPENDTLTSRTTIPDEIQLKDINVVEDCTVIHFLPSPNSYHDYYILKATSYYQNKETNNDVLFYDLSKVRNDSSSLDIKYSLEKKYECDNLKFQLFRVTEDNYNYQLSLWNARKANSDNLIFPDPLDSNIDNGIGIFTCYSEVEFEVDL
jgi:hypothetical protein